MNENIDRWQDRLDKGGIEKADPDRRYQALAAERPAEEDKRIEPE